MAVRLLLFCVLWVTCYGYLAMPLSQPIRMRSSDNWTRLPNSRPESVPTVRSRRGCPMSPYATYLTDQQQQSLAELVTEARQQGADESTVKQHIYKYVGQVLTPQKFTEFQQANEQFESQRRGKRSAEKQLPSKIYDMLDSYNEGKGSVGSDYLRLYEEDSRRLRHN